MRKLFLILMMVTMITVACGSESEVTVPPVSTAPPISEEEAAGMLIESATNEAMAAELLMLDIAKAEQAVAEMETETEMEETATAVPDDADDSEPMAVSGTAADAEAIAEPIPVSSESESEYEDEAAEPMAASSENTPIPEPVAVEPVMVDEATAEPAPDTPTPELVAATDEDVAAEPEIVQPVAVEIVFDRPAWQTLPLVNVATGAAFTFADFSGKTVFVEPMATWCSNCRTQLFNVLNAMATVGSEDVVVVALSVEANLANDDLLSYAESNGYPFEFAVVTPDMLQALVAEFGRGVANPPSTPHFIIRPDGTFTDLATGMETAEQIITEINAN